MAENTEVILKNARAWSDVALTDFRKHDVAEAKKDARQAVKELKKFLRAKV